jgi:hypothetical protein
MEVSGLPHSLAALPPPPPQITVTRNAPLSSGMFISLVFVFWKWTRARWGYSEFIKRLALVLPLTQYVMMGTNHVWGTEKWLHVGHSHNVQKHLNFSGSFSSILSQHPVPLTIIYPFCSCSLYVETILNWNDCDINTSWSSSSSIMTRLWGGRAGLNSWWGQWRDFFSHRHLV